MTDIKGFVESPSLDLIEVCKLLEVETEIRKSRRKDPLKHIIVDQLVDNDMPSSVALEKYPYFDVESPGLYELK